MATAISDTLLTIDESIARSLPIHELVLNNWGYQNSVYPDYTLRGLPAVAGMMIGPRSHIDRVWVQPDLLKTATIPSAFGPLAPYQFPRLCSVGNPIFFPIQGRRDVGAPPLITSLRLLSHRPFPPYASTGVGSGNLSYDSDTTQMPPQYVKAGASGAIAFPLYTLIAGGSVIATPMLQLYLFLVPPTLTLPARRGPYVAAEGAFTDAGTSETFLVAIPAFGRGSGYLQFYTTDTLQVDVRVGGILNGDDGAPAEVIPRESTIVSASGITATNRWRGALKIGGWDYLICYYTRVSGSGQVWARWRLDDDCCASGDILPPPGP